MDDPEIQFFKIKRIKRNTRATIVLGGSQFTRCIPRSKREAKIKKSGRIFCVRQVYFTSKSWRRIWWRVNQPFKHNFSHHVSGKRSTMRPFFIIRTLDRILFFFALFKPIILQFFTILQDKLHSFNIQAPVVQKLDSAIHRINLYQGRVVQSWVKITQC